MSEDEDGRRSDIREYRVQVRGMTDGRVIDLLELLYARGYVMFGEDKEIERLLKELRETNEQRTEGAPIMQIGAGGHVA